MKSEQMRLVLTDEDFVASIYERAPKVKGKPRLGVCHYCGEVRELYIPRTDSKDFQCINCLTAHVKLAFEKGDLYGRLGHGD